MKNRKKFSIILYVAILALAFSWMLGLFGGKTDDVSYSRIVALFEAKQVKSFVVEGNYIQLKLHTPYNDKNTLTTKLADPEGFRQDMWETLQTQTKDGVLESYDFIAGEKLSPWDFVFPIILAGIAILLVWGLLMGRANQNNPMANFGKARVGIGQPGNKKVTFDDVAGVDEEKAELQEVVDFLRNPKKFADIGGTVTEFKNYGNKCYTQQGKPAI